MADPERAAAATDNADVGRAIEGLGAIRATPPENLKVTTPLGLRLTELLLARNG